VTKEGPITVQEAIDFLTNLQHCGVMEWNENIAMASRLHSEDLRSYDLKYIEFSKNVFFFFFFLKFIIV